MPPIPVRRAENTDWPAVAKLLAASGLPLDGAREHFDSYVVAELEGKLVGTAGLEIYGNDALLRSVAVDSQFQGRGVGQALTSAVVDEARGRGVQAMHLLTTSAPDYFARLGFATTPRRAAPKTLLVSAEFRGACPASAVFMTRLLFPR